MIVDWCDHVSRATIDTLPDDVLLCVFDFYVAQAPDVETWHTLVHVCRRWRTVVFASPRRLNLRISCTIKTPAREKLDIWPALPIVISGECDLTTGIDNIKAALKLNDRVCQIRLSFPWDMDEFFAEAEEPFPELTDLSLSLSTIAGRNCSPASSTLLQFLGGSTHLRSLSFTGMSIPGLPEILSSFTDLVDLRLNDIYGFIPPDAMATALSAVTRLKVLHLGLFFPKKPDHLHFHLKSRHLPLPPRAITPSLTTLKYKGTSEYLEDFVALIDVPLLDHLDIVFTTFYFRQTIVLDIRQLLRFISCIPKFQAPDKARISIDTIDPINRNLQIKLWRPGQIPSVVRLEIPSMWPEVVFPCLVPFCRLPLFTLQVSTLECLYIERDEGQYSIRHTDTRWKDLFLQFTSVKNLFLSMNSVPRIAPAFQELIGEGAMEVLPTLENIFIEEFQPSGSVHEAIGQFVAERQLSGQPIVISRWDRTAEQDIGD